jgi:hypothetical protein
VNAMSSNLQVISAAAELMAVLVRSAGSFVRDRFVRLIFPSLELFLELGSLQPSIHSPAMHRATDFQLPLPSFAASRAVDSAMQAVAAVALEVPSALRTFIPRIARYMRPYIIPEEQSVHGYRTRAITGNISRDQYEKERLLKRREWAASIVTGLVQASPDAAWFALAQIDRSGSKSLCKPHTELYDVIFNKFETY